MKSAFRVTQDGHWIVEEAPVPDAADGKPVLANDSNPALAKFIKDRPANASAFPGLAIFAEGARAKASKLQMPEDLCRDYKAVRRRKGRRGRRSRFAGRLGRAARLRHLQHELCGSSSSLSELEAARGPNLFSTPRGLADEEHPWEMRLEDKLNLEAGWLVMFIFSLTVAVGYAAISGSINREKPARAQQLDGPPDGLSLALYDLVWSEGVVGHLVSTGIILLALANFFFYSWTTELSWEADYKFLGWQIDPVRVNHVLEKVSLLIYLPITWSRIATIGLHPEWRVWGRCSACWRYAVTDVYCIAEILALGLALADVPRYLLYGYTPHLNLMIVFFARSFDMLERSGAGLGVRRLKHMLCDDGKLLITAFAFGLVVWLVMSGLYFTANRTNQAEAAVWKVATFDGKPWAKFESIPSTMWFVLINLLKEHPLADAHEYFFSRLWVCIVCIFGMPLFAVPTSILQTALFNAEEEAAAQEAAAVWSWRPEAAPQEPEEEEVPGFYAGLATGVLALGSIVVYFYYTARTTEHAFLCGIPFVVSDRLFRSVNVCVGLVFCVEQIVRLFQQGAPYLVSPLGVIDLLAWLPAVLFAVQPFRAAIEGRPQAYRWWCGACVLRVLKLERYLQSWRDFFQIARANRGVLGATFLLSMLLLMLVSVLIHLTERTNPDPDMRENFGSCMRSIWAEVINLHGEWPWADYTAQGKAVGTWIGLFSIMLFCVPSSIFIDAYQQRICAEAGTTFQGYDRRPWQQLCRPGEPGLRRQAYDLLYAHLHDLPERFERGFVVLRATAFLLVGLTTTTTILGTLSKESFGEHLVLFAAVGYHIDTVATSFFLVEFILRIVATGWRHPFSIIGVLDFVSLAAFVTTLEPECRRRTFDMTSIKIQGLLRLAEDLLILMRLLRLFSLESYLCALHVLKNVVYLHRWPLARAGGSLLSTWFIHATLLYLIEGGGQEESGGEDAGGKEEDEEITMTYRYRSVLSALQYSIVHLFGDYPETDYHLYSKAVHFVGIMGGIAIVASFCGVFGGSFISYLEAEREGEFKQQACSTALTFMRAVRAFQRGRRRLLARRRVEGGVLLRESQQAQRAPMRKILARNIAYGLTPRGRRILHFFNATLLVSILSTMVASLPESSRHPRVEHVCLCVELVCTLVFVVEYTIRVTGHPPAVRALQAAASVSRSRICVVFWDVLWNARLLDLVCMLPAPMKCLVFLRFDWEENLGLQAAIEALSMIRAVRILQFPYFKREVAMIASSLRQAGPKLVIPGYLALCVWITTSALFMWLENYYKDEKTNVADTMRSIPDAMYWCCIFLTGEWANIDFTYAGSRLCIFYVLFGIAMFSIPVGIVVEAVQTTVLKVAEEKREMHALLRAASSGKASAEGGNTVSGVVKTFSRPPPVARRTLQRGSVTGERQRLPAR